MDVVHVLGSTETASFQFIRAPSKTVLQLRSYLEGG